MWDGHGKNHSDCPGERVMMMVNMVGRESCLTVVQSPPQLGARVVGLPDRPAVPRSGAFSTLLATEQQQVVQGSRDSELSTPISSTRRFLLSTPSHPRQFVKLTRWGDEGSGEMVVLFTISWRGVDPEFKPRLSSELRPFPRHTVEWAQETAILTTGQHA